MESSGLALVIGVGDCGCSAINYLYLNKALGNIDFLAINSSEYALSNLDIPVERQLLIGQSVLAGLVSDVDTELSQESLHQSISVLKDFITDDYKIVFILVELGGGIEPSLSTIVPKFFQDIGCVVITILAIPGVLYGADRRDCLNNGIGLLYECSDAVLIFPNDRIASFPCNASIIEGHESSESVFKMPVEIIVRMLSSKEYPIIDFDDFKTVFHGSNGLAAVIRGIGYGGDRIAEAMQNLYSSPYLLNVEIKSINNILLFTESGSENQIDMSDIGIIIDNLQEKFGKNAVIVWGSGINADFSSEIRVSALITGELQLCNSSF